MPQPTEPPSPPGVQSILERLDSALRYLTYGQNLLTQHRAARDRAIADLRVAGWTGRQVADYTGLSVGSISNIDREQGVITTRVARKD